MTNPNQQNINTPESEFHLNPPNPQEAQRMQELLRLIDQGSSDTLGSEAFRSEIHDSNGHAMIPYPIVLLKMVRAENAVGSKCTEADAAREAYLKTNKELIEKAAKSQLQVS
jgi:hypothetical protein